MSRSSACRAQAEPLAAIVAVVAFGVGLSLYAGALGAELPTTDDRTVRPTLERVERSLSTGTGLDPSRLRRASTAAPAGRHLAVTLTTADREWRVGPTPPSGARTATARVAVRRGPGDVVPGRLTVRVWR